MNGLFHGVDPGKPGGQRGRQSNEVLGTWGPSGFTVGVHWGMDHSGALQQIDPKIGARVYQYPFRIV